MSVGPDDVYLALRGLRSLPARLAQHSKTTLDIASWLETLPFIRNVLYPALPSHAAMRFGSVILPVRPAFLP